MLWAKCSSAKLGRPGKMWCGWSVTRGMHSMGTLLVSASTMAGNGSDDESSVSLVCAAEVLCGGSNNGLLAGGV